MSAKTRRAEKTACVRELRGLGRREGRDGRTGGLEEACDDEPLLEDAKRLAAGGKLGIHLQRVENLKPDVPLDTYVNY